MKNKQSSLSTGVGKMIKTLRLQEEWKQKDIAAKLSISIASFSKIEAGFTVISLSRLLQIANLFDVSVQYLLSGNLEYRNQKNIDEIADLKAQLAIKEDEVRKLQFRAISLYDELDKKRKEKSVNAG